MNPVITPIPVQVLLPTEEVNKLLANDTVATRVREKGLFPQEGAKVGVRLNLNVMKTTGQAIQTLHVGTNSQGYKKNKGFYTGEACGYAQAVVLKNAYFNVSQGGREAIARGDQHKHAMASVDGDFQAIEVPADFEGVEIKFNPRNHHLFVDSNNHAVHSAEEVVILGHRAYARGRVVYHTEATAPARAGDFPSQTQFRDEPVLEVGASSAPASFSALLGEKRETVPSRKPKAMA